MAKFNTKTARAKTGAGPIVTATTPGGRTYEGAPGYARDLRSELFLLAVANMVGEDTFYEAANERDHRYANLVRAATVADPEWTAAFLRWLRHDANMRSASIVGAVEFAKARLDAGEHGRTRQVVDSVLVRADEPGELLAYWTRAYGRAVPKPVKRGVADAATRLYTERNLLKYDTASHAYRFGDVLDIAHPAPAADKPWQGALFRYAIDRRHGRAGEAPETLRMIRANDALRAAGPAALLDADAVAAAGMTWEDVLSLAGSAVPKADLWRAVIPAMGYMARLRNLRNFDEAGVPDDVAAAVAAQLADPVEVARSRQLPMRFLSAYRAAPSLRWSWALERALDAALANVPELPGRTLILVDTSGSMDSTFAKDGTLRRWDAATVFGVALGRRSAVADVVSFSTSTRAFPLVAGESLLSAVARWREKGYFFGGGTNTAAAVARHYKGHQRVVILTDEQAAYGGSADVAAAVPAHVPVYTWNLAGYRLGHAAGGPNRHSFGGLTDAGFRMIPLLESGRNGNWPWLDGR